MSNKRKYERYDLAISVALKDKHGVHEMATGNISKYGLFLVTPDPRPLRQLIQLVIEFPEKADTIEVLAQVMWTDETGESERSGGLAGMGVKYFSMPDKDRRKWESFVDRIRSGDIDPAEYQKPKSAGESQSIHSIGEEELEELEDLDLAEVSNEIGEEIISIDEEEITDGVRVEDLSEFEEQYDDEDIPEVVLKVINDKERREFPRKTAAFLVKVKSVETIRDLYTRDISLGGMFLKTNAPAEIGDEVSVSVIHPWTKQEFTLDATVKRIENNSAGNPSGYGVEFDSIDDSMRDSLLTYIESGFVIMKTDEDLPIESEVIKRIEGVEEKIKANPIESSLHYEVGLLYLSLSDWEKADEHIEIASKLGYGVPSEVVSRLERKLV